MIQFQNEHVTVFESALYRTTSTVLQTSELILIVDPNWLPHEVEEIRKHVDEIQDDRPILLLFTHSDYDHIIGYRAFPEAKVIASKALVENPNWESQINAIFDFDEKFYIQRSYDIQYPFDPDIIISEEGQQIKLGETIISFYDAKGHNADGLFAIVQPLGIFIAGDYFSNIEFPFIYHSSEAYLLSLNKVETFLTRYRINLTIPGHGDCCFNNGELMKRQMESIQYIEALRKSIGNNFSFNTDRLWKQFPFRKGMEQEHEKNIQLIRKEIGMI